MKEGIEEYTHDISELLSSSIQNTIFDTNNASISTLSKSIENKSNIVFIIEDELHNIFGCYSKDNTNCGHWNNSTTSLFSLQKGGKRAVSIIQQQPYIINSYGVLLEDDSEIILSLFNAFMIFHNNKNILNYYVFNDFSWYYQSSITNFIGVQSNPPNPPSYIRINRIVALQMKS